MYKTRWAGLSHLSRERKMDLQFSRASRSCSSTGPGTPNEHNRSQPLVPRKASWRCPNGLYTRSRVISKFFWFPAIRPRLRRGLGLASPLQHHAASQRCSRSIQARRRFMVAHKTFSVGWVQDSSFPTIYFSLPIIIRPWPRGGVLDRRDVLDLMHGRSRKTIDPSHSFNAGTVHVGFSPTMQAFACLHQARSAVRCVASRMKGELHPTKNCL